jgi:hypothetical protein
VLGAVYLLTQFRQTAPVRDARPFAWSVDMDTLRTVAVSIPAKNLRQGWARDGDGGWHFDTPDGPAVDAERWGGGIPLLLSAGRANRLIASAATPQQLDAYGLTTPRLRVDLTLADARRVGIEVGGGTPDDADDYVRRADSRDVYSLDKSWAEVVENLVLEPPVASPQP